MKRITFMILMLAGVSVFAQKQAKPNLNKALSALKEGKLAEAKQIIDAATTYEKTMNDGKTWYYRGLVYMALDTTSKQEFKSLEADPMKVSLESFEKAKQLSDAKTEYFVTGADGITPVTMPDQIRDYGNYYLNKGAILYQENDLEGALSNFEKTQVISPSDTIAFFYAGVVANSLEQHDKSLSYLQSYLDKGGKSADAYSIIVNTYSGPKENKEKALEVVRAAKAKFPDNPDFPKVEIGLLIDLNKVDEAKGGLEAAIKREPDNKIFHFYLGYVNTKLEKLEDAKKSFEEALRIDPSYFDAQYYLAQIYLLDAEKIRTQMKNLGISAADKKKSAELDKQLVEKYKQALPHWEKAEKLKGDDVDVLDRLRALYYYLGDDANEKRVAAKLKKLGVEN